MTVVPTRSESFPESFPSSRSRSPLKGTERLEPKKLVKSADDPERLEVATSFIQVGRLTLPCSPLELALELERRGFRQRLDASGVYEIEPAAGLTQADHVRIALWRLHLAAIVEYADRHGRL